MFQVSLKNQNIFPKTKRAKNNVVFTVGYKQKQ